MNAYELGLSVGLTKKAAFAKTLRQILSMARKGDFKGAQKLADSLVLKAGWKKQVGKPRGPFWRGETMTMPPVLSGEATMGMEQRIMDALKGTGMKLKTWQRS